MWVEESGGRRRLRQRDADDTVGFAWGRQGIAARELSRAMLLETTGNEILAEALCRAFTWEMVAVFPASSFRVSQAEVEEWIDRRPAPATVAGSVTASKGSRGTERAARQSAP